MKNLVKHGLLIGMSVLSIGIAHLALGQGQVVSDGRIAHAATGFTNGGANITVGVVGNPFDVNKLAALQGGELPTINMLDFTRTGDDDRTLDALQLIHDMAPAANLVFVAPELPDPLSTDPTVAKTEAEALSNAIDALVAANVHVILDIAPVQNEAVFYEDALALKVAEVAKEKVYIVAVGDDGSIEEAGGFVSLTSHEAPFNPVSKPASLTLDTNQYGYVELVHDFNGAGLTALPIQRTLDKLCLSWADAPNASVNDYDLFVFGGDPLALKAVSADFQYDVDPASETEDGFYPRECIEDDGNNLLAVGDVVVIGTDAIASESRYFHLQGTLASVPAAARYVIPEEKAFEITTGSAVRGRAAVKNVIAAGAAPVPYTSSNGKLTPAVFATGYPSSDYSSSGLRPIFYDALAEGGYAVTTAGDGDLNSPSGADIRVKPDVVGADDVRVKRVSGANADILSDANIVGSIAGAAHIAGLSALVLGDQAAATVNPLELQIALLGSTADLGPENADSASGLGAPLAADALETILLPYPPTNLVLTTGRGSVTLAFDQPFDDDGTFTYVATCTQTDGTGTPTALDSVNVTNGGKIALTPGFTADCKLVAVNTVNDTEYSSGVDTAAAASTGDNTAADLNAPTLDSVTPELYGFQLVYSVDPEALDGTYANTLVCTDPSDTQVVPAETPVPSSPYTEEDLESDVQLNCALDIAASVNGVAMTVGSATFDFQVTPEASTGLPIWLLYEATKAPATEAPL